MSFSGLLNALDGVAAQEGRIIFLTTNHRELLDSALIRPGRIDVEFELGLASREQIVSMFFRFHPEHKTLADVLVENLPERLLSPAQLPQILLVNSEPESAVEAIRAMTLAAQAKE